MFTMNKKGNSLANLKPFEKGHDPRRFQGTRVSDFMRAKRCLEQVAREMADDGTLLKHFRELAKKNPAGFWQTFIVPLLPKQATLSDGQGETIAKVFLGLKEDEV